MKGKYHIEISNRKLRYILDIERKVTVIKGNSGTGKTTLIRMVQGYEEQGNKSGIKVSNETNIPLAVFSPSTNWERELVERKGCIIFVDEAVDYLYTKTFQIAFAKSEHYIVIISRSGHFNHLPYSIHSIFQLKSEKEQSGTLTQMYRLYSEKIVEHEQDVIITEDQNSGKEMMEHLFHCHVISANGNGNIVGKMKEYGEKNINVSTVVDGAAFGGFIAQAMLISNGKNIRIYAPESFEYLLLNTDMFIKYLHDELVESWKYCDSLRYLTWEQYYTYLLIDLCREHYQIKYSKSKLNVQFMNDRIMNQIKSKLCQFYIEENKK